MTDQASQPPETATTLPGPRPSTEVSPNPNIRVAYDATRDAWLASRSRRPSLPDLEPHFRRIVVAFRHVIDGHHAAFRLRIPSRQCGTQVMRERSDATPARQIVGDERDRRGRTCLIQD
jgi:hypothetical protein